MRIIKHGQTPKEVQFSCRNCECKFVEETDKCGFHIYCDGSGHYTCSCPECGYSVERSFVKIGKFRDE